MYFVTICTKDRKNILSVIEKNMICDISKKDVGADASVCPKLTEIGDIVNTSIYNVEKIYENVKIEANIIMPNHIHMIIKLDGQRRPPLQMN